MKQTKTCWNCPHRSPIPTYFGNKYACKKYGYNVKPDQKCVKGDKVFEFQFPTYKDVPNPNWDEHAAQVRYTIGELEEALDAIERGDEQNFLEELMDAHHSNETSLHGFTQDALDDAAKKVIEKNVQRGYYRNE